MLDARTDDAPVDSQSGIFGFVGEYMSTLKRKLEELNNRVADLDEQWCSKSKRIKDWSMDGAFREGKSFCAQQVERVDDLSKEVEEILGHCRFQKGLTTHAAGCRKSSPLVTTKLVGKKGYKTIKKICDHVMDEEIVIIGVYGMGGVGKTTILTHVHNEVLENPAAFNDVFWVTVPQKFNVYELQYKIAHAIGLDNLLKDRDVKRRASILNRHLKKKRVVLILDGLWMQFNFEDVGIPVEKGGIKVVLTTRSLDLCHEMLCQKIIEIVTLEPLDDWSLFIEKLCFGRELPLEVEKIAKSIVEKCGGLPLGIIEIATRMRGVEEVHEWKGMLWKLEESRVELNVFKRLKLSYVKLGDSQVQQCFLHLTQELQKSVDLYQNKRKLIESFIDEGLLDRIGTRQELHEQGHTIVNKLRKSCLCIDGGQYISLHPLMRDMALHVLRSPTHMFNTYMGLKEIPEEKFWTNRLRKVFLQGNEIKKIPDTISPNCPKLTRLLLNNNMFLEAIHESFFRHLKGLKVLDLSQTKIMKLPDTISHLESLEALLLQGCEELRCIPCVQKLRSLRKLDLRCCAMLEEVPEGMEMLVKLSYLDLYGTKIDALSEEVLGKLVSLQYLAAEKVIAKEEELTKVEGLYCSAPNVETFNAYVRFLEQNNSLPYKLWLNESRYHPFWDMHERQIIIKSCHRIAARVDGEIGGNGCPLLPKNVQVLEVGWCDGVTSLCEVGPLDKLEKLKIEKWEKLEELGVVHFPHLRRLKIAWCSKLKHLWEMGQGFSRLQWLKIEGSEELEEINIVAPFLYIIEVYMCPKMNRVMEWKWLATLLPNLRSIIIRNCEKLEEIIGGPTMSIGATCRLTKIKIDGCNNLKRMLMTHDMSRHLPFLQHVSVEDCESIEAIIIETDPNILQPSFLNLIHLTLSNLPKLKSICDGTLSCFSIQYIHITKCPKLRRLPLLDNRLPCSPRPLYKNLIDMQTWRSLEWDHSLRPSSLLRHLARKHEGVPNWHDQRLHVTITYDDIATRAYGEIGGDGCNLLPKNVRVLTVKKGSGVTSLSEVGPLKILEELTIEEWEKLEELGVVAFPHLQALNISRCPKLKHLSMEGQGLPHLLWFIIDGSKELEGIDLIAPTLNHMEVSGCPKMKRVVEWDWLATHLPNLNSIEISCCEKLEEIISGPLPIKTTCLLTKIKIKGCDNIKGVLLMHDMLRHLPFLQEIEVEGCKGIEVIIGAAPNMMQASFPKLTCLTLRLLPKLKRICDQTLSCDNIRFIKISCCQNLKRIPLQLHLLDNGLLSPPLSLGQISIDLRTWQALEWDHPLARISLEPFIEFDLSKLPTSFKFLLSSPSKDRFLTVR
ncbi:hypothetical protein BT93_F1135 [Corymbia citriodora subsp. variegata]|nr:hypothetical protein BT93_F1135 [Corymbia citriodora subsp. variegata]